MCTKIPVCKCQNGIAHKYPSCNIDGKEHCRICNSGFRLPKVHLQTTPDYIRTCTKIPVCTCRNGIPITMNSACLYDGMEFCKSCNSGYKSKYVNATFSAIGNWLVSGVRLCVKIPVCTCQNGTPHIGYFCKIDGQEKCWTCNHGYHRAYDIHDNSRVSEKF